MADRKDDAEREESKGFKVKDNRRFDDEGNERGDKKSAPEKASAAGPEPKAGPGRSAAVVAKPAAEGDDFAMDFSSFVISLATQALMQLGQMKPPEGVQVSIDRNAARQTIDILSMLERKTKGNLEPAEQQLLEDILHNLRLNFIRVA